MEPEQRRSSIEMMRAAMRGRPSEKAAASGDARVKGAGAAAVELQSGSGADKDAVGLQSSH